MEGVGSGRDAGFSHPDSWLWISTLALCFVPVPEQGLPARIGDSEFFLSHGVFVSLFFLQGKAWIFHFHHRFAGFPRLRS